LPNEKDNENVTGTFSILSLGMGLSKTQQQLIIRTLWVLLVTTNALWTWGLLAWLGLTAPFARADAVTDLQHTVMISARLQLTQELRVQTMYWCQAKDGQEKFAVEQTLDRLRDEYRRITGGETPPEFKCP
jgi:hypothetical protein